MARTSPDTQYCQDQILAQRHTHMKDATAPNGQKKKWLSHHLAHGTACTPVTLNAWLDADKRLGYKGMTIVPDLWSGPECSKMTPDTVARVFKNAGMIMQTCGFLAGTKHNLQTGPGRRAALDALTWQFGFVKAAVALEVGPNHMVGPLDIAWMSHKLPGDQRQGFRIKDYRIWLRMLQKFAKTHDTILVIEFLNRYESPNPRPFENLTWGIRGLSRLALHWDTGHAAMLGLLKSDFNRWKKRIRYLELTNLGRFPLQEKGPGRRRIDFGWYLNQIRNLGLECTFGVEPFDPDKVIVPFGLGGLCTTPWPGTDCLAMDARFLREREAMGPVVEE